MERRQKLLPNWNSAFKKKKKKKFVEGKLKINFDYLAKWKLKVLKN